MCVCVGGHILNVVAATAYPGHKSTNENTRHRLLLHRPRSTNHYLPKPTADARDLHTHTHTGIVVVGCTMPRRSQTYRTTYTLYHIAVNQRYSWTHANARVLFRMQYKCARGRNACAGQTGEANVKAHTRTLTLYCLFSSNQNKCLCRHQKKGPQKHTRAHARTHTDTSSLLREVYY